MRTAVIFYLKAGMVMYSEMVRSANLSITERLYPKKNDRKGACPKMGYGNDLRKVFFGGLSSEGSPKYSRQLSEAIERLCDYAKIRENRTG